MGRPRSFDHDLARVMHEEGGLTVSVVARAFGVSYPSAKRAVDQEARAKWAAWQKANRRWVGTCPSCGGPAMKVYPSREKIGALGLCRSCWQEARLGDACLAGHDRETFTYRMPSGQVRCRACETEARRRYRQTHPEQAAR